MTLTQLKDNAILYYKNNETKADIAFFLAGFVFDVITLSEIDDPFSVAQQIVYLLITGTILHLNFLANHRIKSPSTENQTSNGVNIHRTGGVFTGLSKIKPYQDLLFHFLLGSLLSTYSLFFLKSASIFSSISFVVIIIGMMIANELKTVQSGRFNLKLGLYVVCVFCFTSMMYPVLLGFVGRLPFALSVATTLLFVAGWLKLLSIQIKDRRKIAKELLAPSGTILALFIGFYFLGWIPPVPLSVQNMGIYHLVEKKEGQYILHHENPWYKFWNNGDQDFLAEPGDKIYFFAKIFSPGRFNDSVILHFFFKDPKHGWQSADKIPMKVTGGRKGGFRGYAIKQNYEIGDWKISVETTDQREIGRLYFAVQKADASETPRQFNKIIF